jgi:radical SAM protein with 4Fe4S-binding SPASM domain
MRKPLISVIVTTMNNSGELFRKCLTSIKNQTYPHIELIVVDNNSSDNTKEIAREYTNKIFNYGDERSSQRNFGIRMAKGEYFFYLDSDQELLPNSVEEVFQKIQGNDAVFVADNGIGTTFWSKAHGFEKAIHFGDTEVMSPRFFKRSKFLEIGGFDENLIVSEDLELCMRMKKAGFKFGYSNIKINHYEGGGLREVFQKSKYYGKSAVAFLKKAGARGFKIYLIYHPLVYLKNWKYFFKHPVYGTASIARKFVTYLGASFGIIEKFFDKTNYRLMRAALENNQPAYAIFFVTSRCNFKCQHCFYWKDLNVKEELSLNEFLSISKGFDNLVYLNLTGGEPFLREDLDKICFYFYKNSGTKFVAISTNGFFTEKITEKVSTILNSCRDIQLNIAISIDSLYKKHDKFRGVEGSFRNAIKTINLLKKIKEKHPNLNIIINTCYSKYNEDEIKKIYEYLKKLGVSYQRIGLLREDTKDPELTKVSLEKYEDLMKEIRKDEKNLNYSNLFRTINQLNNEINLKVKKNNKRVLPCVAGRKMIVIKENGDVFPCEILNRKMGNLKEFDYKISKLLKSRTAREIKNSIRKNCFCHWGCATQNNIVFNPRMYPKIIYRLLKNKS